MATHSYAYLPLEKEAEFIFSEGWSDGFISYTGINWFKSLLCWNETLRATVLLGGSPCWVHPDEVIIKEEDYFIESIVDTLGGVKEFEDIDLGIETELVLNNLNARKFDDAQNSWLGKLSLEDHIRLGSGINMHIVNFKNKDLIEDFTPTKTLAYTKAAEMLASGELDPGTTYVLDKNVWYVCASTNEDSFWVPLSIALYFNDYCRADVLKVVAENPNVYKEDTIFLEHCKNYA